MPSPPDPAKDTPLRLSRRSLFAGSASLAATALAPAAPARPTQDDAELTALGAKFEQALGVYRAAQAHFNACERRYLREAPHPPSILSEEGPLAHLLRIRGSWWTARELRWPTRRATGASHAASDCAHP